MENPKPTEEEQEQAGERQQEEDNMRYPEHGEPDDARDDAGLDDK